jgi:DNA-binding winged helix-turn-helix (wHTH) protein/Tfp pilus assembly protein PilF/TolB-like protein
MEANSPRIYCFGPFRFDATTGELERAGVRTRLPGQSATVLEALLSRPGQVVTRAELRERLWPNGIVVDFDHGLANAVQRLRDAFGETAAQPRYVETLPRRGYRFVAAVRRVAPSRLVPALSASAWATAAVVVAALAVLAIVLPRGPQPFAVVEGVATPRQRLVVLPFEHIAGDADDPYLMEGLWDELIARLGRVAPQRLAVIARSTALRVDKVPELDIDYALAVSVIRGSAGRLAVSARLLRRDGTQLLAESFQLDAAHASDLPEEIARRVASVLLLAPAEPERVAREHTPGAAAHEAYLRGRWLWNHRTPEDTAKSVEYFREAVALDPDYARAHAALAAAIHFSAAMGVIAREDARVLTRESAERALALDPAAGDALAILAESRFRFGGETESIAELFERAVALRPQDPEVLHWFGMFLASTGRVADALVWLERAREIDPLALHLGADYAGVLAMAGRREEALSQLARVRELEPAFPKTYVVDAAIALDEGRHAEAISALQRVNELSPATPKYLASLAHAYASAGRTDDARRTLGDLRALARQVHVAPELVLSVERDLGVAPGAVP